MAKTPGPSRTIQCYYCGHSIEASERAVSTVCSACHKTILLEDIVVTSYKGVRNVETCGRLIVSKKGRVVAQHRIVAHGGIELEGVLECQEALVAGPVVIGKKAVWQGDLIALSLKVEEGATIKRGYFAIPENWLQSVRERGPPREEGDDLLAD